MVFPMLILHYFLSVILILENVIPISKGISNLTQSLNLLCPSSPCKDGAKSFKSSLDKIWTWYRRCGYQGNACAVCKFIDPTKSITIQGVIWAPVTVIQNYIDSDIYVEYYAKAVKLIEYFMEYVLLDIPGYMKESLAVLHVKYQNVIFNISLCRLNLNFIRLPGFYRLFGEQMR